MLRYNPKKIEAKWQKKWLAAKTYEPDFKHAKKPFYTLMMFPYPSAEGLHIGGMRTFTGVDIYGRMKRMQGHDVFEPIGLDAFGIHSENYALKTGRHPMKQAEVLKKNFYRQLGTMGNGFAWDERLETNDPAYYKWTQWIFTEMFRRGLAYRKKQAVNWCPSCKTVLADEQVVAGRCERCSTTVIQKQLEQWFFKITDYAERLLRNLENIDWSERVIVAQRNWIGRSEGARITFALNMPGQPTGKHEAEVFTTRPDTLFGATFLAISPELAREWLDAGWEASADVRQFIARELAARAAPAEGREDKEKEGMFSGVTAVNPANQEEIPVWIVNYVLGDVGTGAIMAVPAHDERDWDFAKKYNLPIRRVVQSGKADISDDGVWTGGGMLADSGQFSGMASEKAKWEITAFVQGKRTVQYRLRDWLISRQRYWGPPIPMIFCDACAGKNIGERPEMPGWYAVPAKDLPVTLPLIKDFRPTGTDRSPLATVEKFYKVRCPGCGARARRETDVSDTFLDSAWYFLRYPNAKNKSAAWDAATAKKWLPVSMYIGGAEHAVLHLLYSRFLTMAFHDWGMLGFEEPFTRFRVHGLITKDGAKMSKSKGNVVNPDDYVSAYGADAVRMYLAFLTPFEQGGDFRDTGIRGITRFLERVWIFTNSKFKIQNSKIQVKIQNEKLQQKVHRAIKKVTEDIEALQYNTAISALMVLLNEFEEHAGDVHAEDIKTFLKLLAPLAPHMTEELWQSLIHTKYPPGPQAGKIRNTKYQSIHREAWPAYDPALIAAQTFELVVQVNGKVRGRAVLPVGASEADARRAARALEGVAGYLKQEPKKTIFVPDKLINFVL